MSTINDPTAHIEVIHGVNLDMLGRRDPAQYGTITLSELQETVTTFAAALDLRVSFFQTNFEGALVERLHILRGRVDGIILNAGAWSHYAWAIRDALEIAAAPAVEVHLSDVKSREPFRAISVLEAICIASIYGRGVEGYRDALLSLRDHLDRESAKRVAAGGTEG